MERQKSPVKGKKGSKSSSTFSLPPAADEVNDFSNELSLVRLFEHPLFLKRMILPTEPIKAVSYTHLTLPTIYSV